MQTQDDIFYQALLERDSAFEGTFIAGVKTTGIFCRPTCTARKPKRENVEFFRTADEAMQSGYRACKTCKPLETQGGPPRQIALLLERLESDPAARTTDADLRAMGMEPSQVRRWFLRNHGVTFHAFQRMSRINNAFQRVQAGESVTGAAYGSGYDSLSGFSSMFRQIIGVSPLHSKDKRIIHIARIETPLGTMVAGATDRGICMLEYADYKALDTELRQLAGTLKAPLVQGENPLFGPLREELEHYFRGELREFDLPLDPIGTDFQVRVWLGLRDIPYGATATYADQARRLGMPSAVRAVANANGRNKISILLPCHRVIGTDGTLTGYGGGIWRKKKLLELEQGTQTLF